MVLDSSMDCGAQPISSPVRSAIRSIKEVVGDRSDADIVAVLAETHMDPNETAQRLLAQDSFHEVKRKRDSRKENTGFRGPTDVKTQNQSRIRQARPQRSWDQNAGRRGYPQNSQPGIVQVFRVLKDDRKSSKANKDEEPQSFENPAYVNKEDVLDSVDKSRNASDQKQIAARNCEGQVVTRSLNRQFYSGPSHAKGLKTYGDHRPRASKETATTNSDPAKVAQNGVQRNSQVLSATSVSTHDIVSLCSSPSDPIHVPSPDRSAGNLGAIRREVGVVGVRKHSSDRAATSSNGLHSISSMAKDNISQAEKSGQSGNLSKSNCFSRPTSSDSRFFSSSHHNGKIQQQQSVGHQRAAQTLKEWKPKSNQKLHTANGNVTMTASSTPPACADISTSLNQVEVAALSEKIAQAKFLQDEHVIIPKHLQVPESERSHLIFGSFEAGFDSIMAHASDISEVRVPEKLTDQSFVSTSAPVSEGSSENFYAASQANDNESQAETQTNSPAVYVDAQQSLSGDTERLHPQNSSNYSQIGNISNNVSSYSLSEPQPFQDDSALQNFREYDPQATYGVPFLSMTVEDSATDPNITLATQVGSSQPTSISHLSTSASVQQQQQSAGQIYPQIHFPNFLPYRHIVSPLYVPPIAVPNYSSNAAYTHLPNGSSYVVMPGGNSHLSAGGMKYATSQYKTVHASGGTAIYSNYSTGYPISSDTFGSATGLEDANRIKYKDNGLYVPNPLTETTDIWTQTPRDVPGIQSSPFYNMSGQAATAAAPHAAYLPIHAAHPSFSPTPQVSHVQYPGTYPPMQPSMASIASPHHMVHQPVQPGLSGNVGVGVVTASAAQVGAFHQQNQLSHLGWNANY
ncbi:GBF-interacting protein 1-like isoform X2 [Ananas comosus]|uniref:GBF-interacting protein 1-like isoform X2 n=1 Tax=Ananas comosus TaxID=4615 RepID=A0A6P5G7P6_ANACO|nr:GBF-interacting protein 1-like isoform X2 [Ananas comosus]